MESGASRVRRKRGGAKTESHRWTRPLAGTRVEQPAELLRPCGELSACGGGAAAMHAHPSSQTFRAVSHDPCPRGASCVSFVSFADIAMN